MPVPQVNAVGRLEESCVRAIGGRTVILVMVVVVIVVALVFRLALLAGQLVSMNVDVVAACVLVEDQPGTRQGAAPSEEQRRQGREP